MKNRSGRVALIVAGVVALLIGGVWVGQGANLIPGSFMTGDRTWFYVGLVVAVGGIVLVALGLKRTGSGR
ncbi:MAG: hypothetical protein ACOH1J_02140 [Microbacteriaceae bacterium]